MNEYIRHHQRHEVFPSLRLQLGISNLAKNIPVFSYISYSWTYAAVSLCINQSHDTYYKTLFNSLSFFIIILAIDRILISTPKTLRMKLGIIFFSICCCCCKQCAIGIFRRWCSEFKFRPRLFFQKLKRIVLTCQFIYRMTKSFLEFNTIP